MIIRILAAVVVVLHLGFVLFVMIEGFLLMRWPKLVYAHVPDVHQAAPFLTQSNSSVQFAD